MIEHSYKADSDLSPAGWEYAERLKEFIVERRTKNIEHRRKMGLPIDENKKLVVSQEHDPCLFTSLELDAGG